jgi:hypothetical protein
METQTSVWRSEASKEQRRRYNREYAKRPKVRLKNLVYWRQWRLKHKERLNRKSREYNAKNKEKRKLHWKQYDLRNRDARRQAFREYYAKHKDRLNANRITYFHKHKRQQMTACTRRTMARYHSDGVYRLQWNVRAGISQALRGKNKSTKSMQLVGCSLQFLKGYLEGQFKKGMTWDNYGKWHVDHVMPCASFDLSLPEEQRRCFHYTNLQPMWGEDNNRKNAKVPAVHQPNLF